jgi:hypothetical protein
MKESADADDSLVAVCHSGSALSTFCFEAVRTTLPNLARGVANRTESAGWYKFSQTTFSFICRPLLHNCPYFPQLALHFRDSRHYQPNAVEDVRLLAVTWIAARLRFPSTSTECNRVKSRQNPVVGQFEN